MSLSNFSNLMVEDSNSAKNFLSLLIGHYRYQENYGKAIYNLYESFSDTIKKDEKVFEPIIYKYFLHFDVKDYNHSLYKNYSKFWSAEKLKVIQDANPDYQEIQTKIEYKNSLVFTKAVDLLLGYRQENTNEVFEFLKEEKDTVNNLIKKDKNKFILNFLKHNVWVKLLNLDYHEFKDFCHRHDFNYVDIIKQFKEHTYEIDYYLYTYNNTSSLKKNILEFLDDIGIKDGENNKDYFFGKNQEKVSILDIVSTLIHHKEYDKAYDVISKFPLDVNNIIEKMNYNKNKIDFESEHFWFDILSYYFQAYKRKNLKDYRVSGTLDNSEEFAKYISIAKFDEKIPEKDHNKTKKMGVKV